MKLLRILAGGLLGVLAAATGCATTEVRLGDAPPDASSGGPLVADAAGLDAGPLDADLLLCIGTTCPAPFATCNSASGPTFACGTDLAHDPDNCGSCGTRCLTYPPLHMGSTCVDGACELACRNEPGGKTQFRDCNGAVDDGCEVDVYSNAQHCGACGKACGAGVSCIHGKCGCPTGQIECPDESGLPKCTNPKIDDANCGGCGTVCGTPPGACNPLPRGAYYGCHAGTCGHLKCGGYSADCNGDLGPTTCKTSDGCEVQDLTTDRNNCGGCGIACVGAEECVNEGNGFECAVPCARFGRTSCPNAVPSTCVDLLGDPSNCGGCGNDCPAAGPHQLRACDKGLCLLHCATGFADCNGSAADGCEVNLAIHAGNCGACGHACDVANGQPCVEGRCLVTACDAGVTR